jgi:hypothetical protein
MQGKGMCSALNSGNSLVFPEKTRTSLLHRISDAMQLVPPHFS